MGEWLSIFPGTFGETFLKICYQLFCYVIYQNKRLFFLSSKSTNSVAPLLRNTPTFRVSDLYLGNKLSASFTFRENILEEISGNIDYFAQIIDTINRSTLGQAQKQPAPGANFVRLLRESKIQENRFEAQNANLSQQIMRFEKRPLLEAYFEPKLQEKRPL